MRETIEKVVKALVYASFFVPLVVVPSSFIFPFIVPKIIFFRVLAVCMGAGYGLLLVTRNKQLSPRLTWVSGALLAFFLSFTISTFVGVDAYHSFWDNHERMLGLFTIFHYVLYFFVLSAVFKTWSDWKFAAKFFLIAGSCVMLIGALQVADPYFLLNQGSERVASTLGNSIYVGAYGLFLLFLSALIFTRESEVFWKWVSVATAILSLLGIVYSGSRGSLLGLAAGGLVASVMYMVLLKEHPRVRKSIAGMLLAGVFVFGLLYFNRGSSFVQNVPAFNRLFSTTFESVADSPRAMAWKAAVESWKERPVFGWGPNNFYYAFNKYYDPHSLRFGYGETWFDNAHNIILNTLSVQGLFGVISYLAIFVVSVIALFNGYREGRVHVHLFVIGAAFLVAHLTQNITVFENPTSYLYFMFWLAMINRLTQKPLDGGTEVLESSISGLKLGVAGALVIFINLVFNLEPAFANMDTLASIQLLHRDPVKALPEIQKTLAVRSPHIDDIRSDVGRQLVDFVSQYYQKLGVERSLEMLNIAASANENNLSLHPFDVRMYLLMVQLNQVALQITGKVDYLLAAEKYAERAFEVSPARQQVIYGLANIKLQLQRNNEAIQLLTKALESDPLIAESYWRLMAAYKMGGNEAKVREVYALSQKNKIVFTADELSIVNQVLSATTKTKK